jgi:iron complex outermembrane receptor protein
MMIANRSRHVRLMARVSCAALALVAGIGTASAQDAPAAETMTETDIIVTAQKRAQSLQDVPISIQVVSGKALQDSGIRTFEDLGPMVPNFTVVKSPAANIISMRGVASSAGSPSLEQSVVMFVDGIYGGNARQFAAPFLDIERMEVLRGPQGALVGKNTNAGAINIVTRKPGFEFGGYVRADYAIDPSGPTVEGALDIPIADNLALRVVGKYSDVDGYIYNSFSKKDQPSRREIVGRAVLHYDAGGPVTMTAKYEHADVNVDGSPVQIMSALKGRGIDHVKESGLAFSNEFDNIRTDTASVQFDIEVGTHTLTSITGYSHFVSKNRIDADFTEVTGASADFDMNFNQMSQELRLLSPTGQTIEYVVGAYYQVGDLLEERTTGVLFAPAASTYRVMDQDNRVWSFYGQLTANISDSLRAIGGLRYTHERKSATYKRFSGPNTYTDLRTGTQVANFSDSLREGIIDPSATVQYDVSDNAMAYFTYSRGSKGGGFQGAISNAAAFSFQFQPERSESFEAGAKLTFPGVGHLNLAAYRTKYTNLQVSVALPSPDGLSAPFFTGNAGDAVVKGIELDGVARLGGGFELTGNVAWTPSAKYLEYGAGPCYTGQVPNGTQPGSCNLTGLRLNFTPKWSGAVSARYSGNIGSDLKFTGSVTTLFQSFSRRDSTQDPLAVQPAYAKIDARIGIGAADDSWELAVIGRNLTDKTTVAFVGAGGLAATVFSPDSRSLTVDAPRTFAVQASYKF